jgi:amidase
MDTFDTAVNMLKALQTKQISASELLELHLAQIEKHNPKINAIVIPNFENARETAKTADAAIAKGEDKALLGLSLTIKDCIHTGGMLSTAGVKSFADNVVKEDGVLSRRVRTAGAVIIGKTNVPPFAGDWQASNELFGRTVNPWDETRTPGGSTGGGAAALASGMTPLEFGSDIGGSIRIPAAFCGVFGHRPSDSALARSGHLPGSALPNPASLMGVQGPLARSAADLELAMRVVAGAEIGEEVGWTLTLPPARHKKLREYRVAVLATPDWVPIDNEIARAMENLVSNLSKMGAKVATAQPEGFGDWKKYHKLYLSILQTIMSLEMSLEQRQQIADAYRTSSDEFDEASAKGYLASAGEYITWLEEREIYRQTYRQFFKDWDVLLSPITIVPAFTHTDLPFPARTLEINDQTVPYIRQIFHPSVATLAGQPATAFPLGLNKQGLPMGAQVVGAYLEDYTPLEFAKLVEAEFGGFQRPPGF